MQCKNDLSEPWDEDELKMGKKKEFENVVQMRQ